MTESHLTSALLRTLRETLRGAVVLKHNDRTTSGIPDFSVTLGGRTSWWEVKAGAFASTGIQELTAQRLAAAGICYYIVYTDRTLIVEPRNLRSMRPVTFAAGIDHRFVREFIRRTHEV